jgi:hypothetical protein
MKSLKCWCESLKWADGKAIHNPTTWLDQDLWQEHPPSENEPNNKTMTQSEIEAYAKKCRDELDREMTR